MHTAINVFGVLVVGAILGLVSAQTALFLLPASGNITDGPWHTNLEMGSPASGPYLRARIALHGLLALTRSEAVYYAASTDSSGNELSGKCEYSVDGRDPPARWWSVTAYGLDDYLIPNPAGRYSVSSSSVKRREDGAFTIVLSKGARDGNWIPVSERPFFITIRLYDPSGAVAVDPAHVKLPVIRRTGCA